MVCIYEGLLYRALNPRWASQPLSGDGAAIHGGRFNPRGMPALYTSLSPMTALKEAQQVGTFQPVTLVAYEAKIARLFDARDPESLEQRGIAPALLADPTWRDAMLKGRPAPSQTFGANLKADGVQGLLVQSFVTGADDQEVNIVVLAWNSADGCQLRVIDD